MTATDERPARILDRDQSRRMWDAVAAAGSDPAGVHVQLDDLVAALEAAQPGIAHDADVYQDGYEEGQRNGAAWHEGYSAGQAAGIAARPAATVYLPVTRRWRHVQPGDVFVGKGAALWQVTTINPGRGTLGVVARHGEREYPVTVDPDSTIDVLVQRPEADALDLLAHQLGATITGQTGPAG